MKNLFLFTFASFISTSILSCGQVPDNFPVSENPAEPTTKEAALFGDAGATPEADTLLLPLPKDKVVRRVVHPDTGKCMGLIITGSVVDAAKENLDATSEMCLKKLPDYCWETPGECAGAKADLPSYCKELAKHYISTALADQRVADEIKLACPPPAEI